VEEEKVGAVVIQNQAIPMMKIALEQGVEMPATEKVAVSV
jgi:hypothetical protein